LGTTNDFAKPEILPLLITLGIGRFPIIAVINLIIRLLIEFNKPDKLEDENVKQTLEEIVSSAKIKEIVRRWKELSPEQAKAQRKDLTEFLAKVIRMEKEESDQGN
jgi:hypothetical protein